MTGWCWPSWWLLEVIAFGYDWWLVMTFGDDIGDELGDDFWWWKFSVIDDDLGWLSVTTLVMNLVVTFSGDRFWLWLMTCDDFWWWLWWWTWWLLVVIDLGYDWWHMMTFGDDRWWPGGESFWLKLMTCDGFGDDFWGWLGMTFGDDRWWRLEVIAFGYEWWLVMTFGDDWW